MARPLFTETEERRGIALARGVGSREDLAALFERVRRRAVELVERDERLRERLTGHRVRLIGADYDEDKPDPEGRPTRLGRLHYFDHERGTAVQVTVDLRRGEVIGLDERRGAHLRPSEEEIQEATDLLRRSEHGRHLAQRQVSAVAFPARSTEEDDPAWTHRRVELHLWSTDRLPERLASAVVDLTAGTVLPYDEDREG